MPNFNSAPSSMPKLYPISYFPHLNPLVPGVKLLEVCERWGKQLGAVCEEFLGRFTARGKE